MEISNKVGWLIIIVVLLILAFVLYKRYTPKSAEGPLPEPQKPAGGVAPMAPTGPEGGEGQTAPGGGGIIFYFPAA